MNALAPPMAYPEPTLFIDGEQFGAESRQVEPVFDPSTNEVIAQLPHASIADLDRALDAAQRAFHGWRNTPALERSRILRAAAQRLRESEAEIATNLTRDQGKPLAESLIEVRASAEHMEWHAEECRRIYGRVIPARAAHVHQYVAKEPIGVCVALTPWNFPLSQAVRKVAAALGAGCTLVLKGPENTPSAVLALAKALDIAGLPKGCLNLVWGVPSEVSHHLLQSPIVKGVSFTGSVPVGKSLAALAGQRMLRATFELGGHAPAIVFEDADLDVAATVLAASKFRNAGQVCIAPSRIYVHEAVHDAFVERFCAIAGAIKVGPGLEAGTQMGALAHRRRVGVMQDLTADALKTGASLALGGEPQVGSGNFFAPTVLLNVSESARVMNEEPFGPVAPIARWSDVRRMLECANRLPYGLAGFAFTRSSKNASLIATELDVGQLGINHFGLAVAELPMGGVNDSGVGYEGGSETFDGYLKSKVVTHLS